MRPPPTALMVRSGKESPLCRTDVTRELRVKVDYLVHFNDPGVRLSTPPHSLLLHANDRRPRLLPARRRDGHESVLHAAHAPRVVHRRDLVVTARPRHLGPVDH